MTLKKKDGNRKLLVKSNGNECTEVDECDISIRNAKIK